MKITITQGERATMKDYIGTLFGMLPKSEQENAKNDLVSFPEDIQEIMTVFTDESNSTVIDINEELIIQSLCIACDIVVDAEKEIRTLFALLNSLDDKERKEIVKDAKDVFEESIHKLIKEKIRRKCLYESIKGFLNKCKNKIDQVKEMLKNGKEQ